MVRLLLAALAGSVLVAGCARSAAETRTYVGQVTEVEGDTVCVGGPEASGECFVKDQVTERLRLKDCVTVTYSMETPDPPGPYRATKILPADPDSHRTECPEL